jgi:hypothetical protein
MADFKRQMFRHLRSARQWLARAEESFDKDSNIRGELDLLLAQAELQHVREANSSRQWRYKYPLIRHALSAALATTILAAGIGFYWWSSERDIAVPIPLAAQEPKSVPAVKAAVESAASQVRVEEPAPATPVVISAVSSPINVQPAAVSAKNERLRQVEQEDLLPPDELQKVIRAAGKSLRGQ